GTDFGLAQEPGIRESGSYLLGINGYTNCFNFGDGGSPFRDSAILHWFANYYNMPELSLFQREYQSTNSRYDEYLALLWYNPDLVEGLTSADRPMDHFLLSDYYESIASFRSFPGSDAQVYAAIKSGNNQTGHTDFDVGTFVMEAMGELWFMDLGKDNYGLPGYMDRSENGGRWVYYRTRAEGQNTLVVNPDSTGGQVFDAKCQITDYFSAYDGGYAIVDMKDAYDGYGVKSVRRSLALFDNRTRVRLRDEINCSSASTIYWFAHTKADISISADGKTATLTQNGKKLIAQIATPDGAKFTTMDAKPLSSSPNPSGQDANAGIRKLVIKLTKTTSASITVFFTPALTGNEESNSLPTYGITNTYKLLKQYDPATFLVPNEQGIYEISTPDQLCLLSDMVAQGNSFSGKTVALTQDINMLGRSLLPIGGNSSGLSFSGTFDGQGHMIKNLQVFEPEGEGVGLFGKASKATIRNLGISDGLVIGGKATGGLIGLGSNVTIENSFSRCNVISYDNFGGGLVGQLGGTSTIQNSYHNGYVKVSGNVAGGIAGYLSSSTTTTIENCYHVGNLTDSSGRAGMVGHYNTESSPITKLIIKNSYSTTALKGGDIVANSALESFSGNKRLTESQLVSAAVSLGTGYIYDCEWENGGYPVLSWECDTLLPEDLVLTTAGQLRRLAYEVNSGTSDFSGKVVLLGKNIDLESREWIPIGGNNAEDSSGKSFRGTFDGQGYSVSNVYISSGYHYVGFFGNVVGNVMNFGIKSGSISGGNKSAGLAGYCRGTVSACYSRATVSGTANAGGLIGMTGKIQISESYAVASVTATGNTGGLIGYLSSAATDSTVTNSYAACSLSGKTCGGLIASVNTSATGVTITNSYALSGASFLGSATGCTLKNASSQSADNLKAKAEALGKAFLPDSYIPLNSGYPVLTASAYKTPNMAALTPNQEGVYEIHTAQELRRLAYMVNVLGNTFSGRTVKLLSDIDLENEEWIPIGGNAVVSGGACSKFSGIFEGGGHKIRNLTVSGGNYYVGFFGRLEKGQVHNLGIDSGMVMGTSRVAGLVGSFNGGSLISGCYNKANVFGQSNTGGIVGMSGGENSQILNCYNTGSVGSNSNDGNGGIVGYVSSSTNGLLIQNCYNAGIVGSGIAALINESAILTVDNCYTLDTAELTGAGANLTLTNSSQLSAATLRESASSLGTAYAEDFFTRNRIYPVLAWENGDRSTTIPEENGVYAIYTPDQLRLVSYAVRKGNTFQGKTIELRGDLDLQNLPWLSIGGKDEATTYYFRGTLDGKGHRIHNLNSVEPGLGYAGLLGAVRNATIQNLGIESGVVTGYTRSASIAAYVHEGSTIRNCYTKATVFANSDAGSIAGTVGGQNVLIENCYNTGVVFAKARTGTGAGLIGYATNSAHNLTVRNCYNVGNYFGIIARVGDSATNILVENSYSVGTVALHRLWASPNYADAKQISADALKDYATVLGSAYEADAQSINGGYPILAWETAPQINDPTLDSNLKINHTLNLASDISVNLVVEKALLEGFDMATVYMETEIPVYEGNTLTGTRIEKLLPVEDGNFYYFTITGLTAVKMNDKLFSVLYGTKDGQPYYSATDLYCIADYAYSQLNKTNIPDRLKILCANLLRYGSAAQKYKAYRTDTLADSNMTEEHRAYLSNLETLTFGNTNTTLNDLGIPVITWAGKALDLNSKVTLKFVMNTSAYAGNAESLRLMVRYTDYEGREQTLWLTGPELYSGIADRYAFSFNGLLAAELRTEVSVQVYEGETPLSCTLCYSADTYGNNKTGTLGELCKALFAYSDSAKSYFAP
ncbi:MAG: heparinase II/III family protein, partial [Oscillospiraceae bacterium]|nr:heparinase II/III family protein [Oscillospiraceae bacterium]